MSVRRVWKYYCCNFSCCNFSKYIWRSPLHYKIPVCCDLQCERRDLCALSEDTWHMHPNCSQTACWIFFFSVYLSFTSHAGHYIWWPRSVFFFVRYFSVGPKTKNKKKEYSCKRTKEWLAYFSCLCMSLFFLISTVSDETVWQLYIHSFYCHEGLTFISFFGEIYLVFLLVVPLFLSQLCSLAVFFFPLSCRLPFSTCVWKCACRGTVWELSFVLLIVCWVFFSYSYCLENFVYFLLLDFSHGLCVLWIL